MKHERLPLPLLLLIAIPIPLFCMEPQPSPPAASAPASILGPRPAEGDGLCERPNPPFAVCGEVTRYDNDGWRTPPGPPPGGLFSVGGTVGSSHHCGNRITLTMVAADGGRESFVYEDKPCQETGP